jgi:hypothetical protein
MSSLVRRIQRQVVESRPDENGSTNPPRKKFYLGRGKQLGVKNPKCKALLARKKREAERLKRQQGI